MKIVDWKSLSEKQRDEALARPRRLRSRKLFGDVQAIIDRVRRQGDTALLAYAKQFDNVALKSLAVTDKEFAAAENALDPQVKAALIEAIERISRWHEAGMAKAFSVKTAPGVHCGRIIRPIRRVGLYIPAGSAPLPSTVMMLAIPAKLAGCPDVVLCSPPQADGRIDPAEALALMKGA